MIRKRPLLLVEWQDITSTGGWIKEKDCLKDEPIIAYSVGWKMPSPKGKLVITSMRDSRSSCNDRVIIPRGCIKNIRRLE